MITKRYRCPACDGIFRYDHHPSIEADPLPANAQCPHCGFSTESEFPPAVVAPHIRKPIRDTVDNLHREMEAGEQFRADLMVEKFGFDRDEARSLVATDMRDGLREGDTSYVPVNNTVSQTIEAHPNAFGFSGGAAQGVALSPHVQSGPYANAGAHAMKQLREIHPKIVAASGHRTVASTSLPANETQQPGYRPRT